MILDQFSLFVHNGLVSFKSKDKNFFDDIYPDKLQDAVENVKEDFEKIEKRNVKKFLGLYDFGVFKLRQEIKKRPAYYFFLFLTSFLGSVITSSVALFIFAGNVITQYTPKPEASVMSAQAETAKEMVRVEKFDPLLLTSKLRSGEKDFILIDIRSKEDYDRGHILKAVNLPIFGTKLMAENGDLNQAEIKKLMGEFLDLGLLVIIYGQNSYSTTPTEISEMLSERFSNVKPLAIGYEEWVHLNK